MEPGTHLFVRVVVPTNDEQERQHSAVELIGSLPIHGYHALHTEAVGYDGAPMLEPRAIHFRAADTTEYAVCVWTDAAQPLVVGLNLYIDGTGLARTRLLEHLRKPLEATHGDTPTVPSLAETVEWRVAGGVEQLALLMDYVTVRIVHSYAVAQRLARNLDYYNAWLLLVSLLTAGVKVYLVRRFFGKTNRYHRV